jgi:hypothetical protein
MCCPCPFPQL